MKNQAKSLVIELFEMINQVKSATFKTDFDQFLFANITNIT